MTIKQLSKIAEEIKMAYAEGNRKKGRKIWAAPEYAQAFVGDVGDLLKYIVSYTDNPTKAGYKKISHELADCLWSVIIIAQELGIDVEREYLINMEYLKQKLFEKR
ncbi:MAG: MazG nucleotide pyrophosphohydrolase [Candidatus Yanofskybacteria bacterium GW2011_GWA1_44_21]|uniref:Uncharacterized protein n=2 Tax=Candidatus Yanofskyibacteriota TaxID=1752733 RepID=A0A1F8GZ59_9BACT|nr:MAG: MazG nucleotide pyrophosphohydrolase [Candidatus Yanofskybacteria bacterium GW2011_GWA2_44_10]KKT50600.1 MAG: MazG nucleotide pyrophosphohydrolase [Candidatus Yanofskybacteria bacterium GW2011_GWA1_44_21]KKT90114.1 MAG: MazG nucleotide pyrophosphohydrolase [Candidatus Yanofskybacteria bacterium GW2011_GWB1_45_11]OGN02779.1 MAG: hypothetical protein A2657_01390 [Candidatus Yanofskybacteria bacterium RIFCSPHIGHO2_01_FULL_44_110b]OGN14652.1 MAG: hypothetical protein A3C01_03135 [Candidatus